MPALTSLGIGSGVDINTMLTQLVALERRPIEQLKTEATRLQTRVSAFGKMQSLVAAVQDAANALTGPGLWSRSVAKSANEGLVATVGGSTAAPGSYSVADIRIAAAQTVVSASAFADAGALVGAGTLTLELGAWDAGRTAFTAKGGTTPVTLDVTAADTVQTLRDKINALNAGVTASIVNDASGTRLALRSSATGASNGFRVTAADADGNATDAAGLSRVAYDPPAGTVGMLFSQAAADAAATVNGIAVTSTANELGGVIDGLTLRLRAAGAGPVDIDVSADREAIGEAVKKFAEAFNELARYIGDQTKYDPATKVAAALQGDSAVTSLLGRLRGVVNGLSGASSAFPRLSDLGLQMQRDGTLSVNQGRLDAALSNLPEMRKAFAHLDTAVPANDGFARRFAALATEVLGVDGTLSTRTEGLRKLIAKNSDRQQSLEARVERYERRLVQQFTAMDSNLSRLNALNSYVTQQLAALTQSQKSG